MATRKPKAERSARQKRRIRAAKAAEARNDRFAFVTVTVDRQAQLLFVHHPWISAAEARGVLEVALESCEVVPNPGVSPDANWDWEEEGEEE